MKPDSAYIAQAIANLVPGIVFEVFGESFAGVVRHSGPPLPPEADVLAEMARIKAAEPLVSEALTALAASDGVALRCAKAAVPYPPEWQAYDAALRAIVRGGPGPVPPQPDYPTGT